ncbi:hypothetical protein BD289DRAFT_418248 [Coniella lustricola]|uniref:Delta(24)-sterol reductase n=1 Tax=Coniella lustricola TaxID=2025994 RepID=A0A2T2ZTW6_9PEZI|nr:hypothetical protein BD289DRAFT_418248 [Coniella lustricola]
MERHRALLKTISKTVQEFYAAREPYRIFHGSTNSTRPTQAHARSRVVDISALRNVLSVDTAARTALVEPNVPMDALVSHTLKYGLVPPVVMEFPGITAGGGFAGTAGESSSFQHGFFDDTVRSVEMVLPDGEVVTARPGSAAAAATSSADTQQQQHASLFRGAAGAVGTLGVTTLLELNLVQARKFVRTRYQRTSSVAEAVALVKEETKNTANDYVDGILFSKTHGVVITGQMTDDKPASAPVQTFSRASDPWFYMHVQERTQRGKAAATAPSTVPEDYVPLAEYLFRYDRAGFWVGRAGWRYFKVVPFNRFTRWFLDDFMHTRMLYRALHGSGESARFIVQDVAMPFATTEKLVDYTAAELDIWPLWLCPLKRRAPPTFHPYTTTPAGLNGKQGQGHGQEEEEDPMMLNVGVWGWGPAKHEAFVTANRALEAKVKELGGMKWLYAHTYYDEPEFWEMYGGRGWYDELRRTYKADQAGLPSVYDKVKVDLDKIKEQRTGLKGVRPFGGLYGIWKSIQSKDYLLHRNAEWKWKGE